MLLCHVVIPPPMWRHLSKSLCEKTGKQITGWVQMSHSHVSHGGPKYTIISLSGRGMSLV